MKNNYKVINVHYEINPISAYAEIPFWKLSAPIRGYICNGSTHPLDRGMFRDSMNNIFRRKVSSKHGTIAAAEFRRINDRCIGKYRFCPADNEKTFLEELWIFEEKLPAEYDENHIRKIQAELSVRNTKLIAFENHSSENLYDALKNITIGDLLDFIAHRDMGEKSA